MHVIARSNHAICQSFFTVLRVTSVAARRSTALVFTRTCSTQSRFSEVPRFASNSRPFSLAIAPPARFASPGTKRFPARSEISSRISLCSLISHLNQCHLGTISIALYPISWLQRAEHEHTTPPRLQARLPPVVIPLALSPAKEAERGICFPTPRLR